MVTKAKIKVMLPLAAFTAGSFLLFSVFSQEPKAADEKALDKAAVEEIISNYLKENPEIVIDALESYQEIQQRREEEAFAENLKKHKETMASKDAPSIGPAEAEITVVEFFDYNCGYCKRAVKDIQSLIKDDDKVRVVFKDLPILSDNSNLISRWALAANKQGKYWEYHQALMNHAGTKGEQTLEKLAEEVGLDVKQLKKDADSKEVREELEKNAEIARELGVRGTPAFVIEDVFAPGYMGYDNMKSVISDIREEKS